MSSEMISIALPRCPNPACGREAALLGIARVVCATCGCTGPRDDRDGSKWRALCAVLSPPPAPKAGPPCKRCGRDVAQEEYYPVCELCSNAEWEQQKRRRELLETATQLWNTDMPVEQIIRCSAELIGAVNTAAGVGALKVLE